MAGDRVCPKCGGKMELLTHGSKLPKVPFVSTPSWVKHLAVYTCENCGYIELWIEKRGKNPYTR